MGLSVWLMRLDCLPPWQDLVRKTSFHNVSFDQNLKFKILVEQIFLVSKKFFGVPSFCNYAIADGPYNLLFPDKSASKSKCVLHRIFSAASTSGDTF
jgi:hypothetical protein